MPRRRLIALAAATAVAALAPSAPALADSISFIRAGDVWVASPDGRTQVQVTHTGAYSYASQADDGTFIALAGRRLHRLDRQGRVLADFTTPVSAERTGEETSYFLGPFDPEISPDGTRVAYEYNWQYIARRPDCTWSDWYCLDKHLYQGVGYTSSMHQSGWEDPDGGHQSGWIDPSWLDGDRVLLSNPSEPLNLDVMVDRVGTDNQDIQGWFSDDAAPELRDGEVNRQGTAMAFVSYGTDAPEGAPREDRRVTVYRTTGAAPQALPEHCFQYGPASGRYEDPSWSPGGDRLAVADVAPDGTGRVLVAEVPGVAGGCTGPGAAPRVAIENARHPDWGPADVPAVAPAAAPAPAAPAPVAVRPGGPAPAPAAGAVARTLALRGGGLRRALRRGVDVTFQAPGAGRASATALLGARVVASGGGRAARAGRVTVRLAFTAAGRRALAGRASARLTVRVAFRAG